MPTDPTPTRSHKGRGAASDPPHRFAATARSIVDDGWEGLAATLAEPSPATQVLPDHARSILASNQSPDIPFDRSINPYRGCEHGCIYCYARPFHAHLGHSSGLEFETKIYAKHDAAKLLRAEFARPGYRPSPIALGAVTDPYQPVERRLRITRSILEVMVETRHPVGITTKSAGVLADLDLLQELARQDLVAVHVSVTSLDRELSRTLEPRCTAPAGRLKAIEALKAAGVPVFANLAPIIPGLNDHEIEKILAAVAEAGAIGAGWILVRLPFEVKELFTEWLEQHRPERARHVLSLIRQARGGQLNEPEFGARMRGEGPLAALIAQRFQAASRKHGLVRRREPLRSDLFRRPSPMGQLSLF